MSCIPSSILSKREFVSDRLIEDEIYFQEYREIPLSAFTATQTLFAAKVKSSQSIKG